MNNIVWWIVVVNFVNRPSITGLVIHQPLAAHECWIIREEASEGQEAQTHYIKEFELITVLKENNQ